MQNLANFEAEKQICREQETGEQTAVQWIDEKALETWATFLNAREIVMASTAEAIAPETAT